MLNVISRNARYLLFYKALSKEYINRVHGKYLFLKAYIGFQNFLTKMNFPPSFYLKGRQRNRGRSSICLFTPLSEPKDCTGPGQYEEPRIHLGLPCGYPTTQAIICCVYQQQALIGLKPRLFNRGCKNSNLHLNFCAKYLPLNLFHNFIFHELFEVPSYIAENMNLYVFLPYRNCFCINCNFAYPYIHCSEAIGIFQQLRKKLPKITSVCFQ